MSVRIRTACLLVLAVAAAACEPAAEREAAQTRQDLLASLTVTPPGAFYEIPAEIASVPGALLRSEPLTEVVLPEGMQAWRIFYATTVDDETPAGAVATVFAPAVLPAGPLPVITWAHGTVGLVQRCMPSLVSAPTEGIPARERIVAEGWVVVATDYSFTEPGGPHPYLIGEGEARAALDAFRAARQMPELMLDVRTVVWGHSQGGHAALWTGIVAPRYAPELDILGVAGIAPAADVGNIFALNPAVERRLGAYVAGAYGRFYADLTFEGAVRPEALDIAREIVDLCGFVPREHAQRIAALVGALDGPLLNDPASGALSARLAENAAEAPIAAPVLIAQGLADDVVPPVATDAYVDRRCAAGQRLEYWTLADLDHGNIVQPGSALEEPLIAWTKARFAGELQASGCARAAF